MARAIAYGAAAEKGAQLTSTNAIR